MRANGSMRAVLGVALAVADDRRASAAPMGFDDARHLLARTGFGPTDAEIRGYAALTREQGVNLVLRDVRTQAITPPPAFTLQTTALRYPARGHRDARGAARVPAAAGAPGPRASRLVDARDAGDAVADHRAHDAVLAQPLRVEPAEGALRAAHVPAERDAARERARQLRRRCCTRRRRTRRCSSTSTPRKAARAQPNENFAREVMELFTLGEGQYTESDIKEAARAFTGWSLDRETGRYLFRPSIHDAGVKTVLGKSGRFDGDAVLDVILERPQTAEFITAKLWREFVSAEPGSARGRAHRQGVSQPQLRHQGRAARACCSTRCVLGPGQSRDAGEEPGRARRRHAAPARRRARRRDAVRRRRGGHGPEPLLAAEREGLARRRAVDQQQFAARAKAVPRPPRAHGRRAVRDDGDAARQRRRCGACRALRARGRPRSSQRAVRRGALGRAAAGRLHRSRRCNRRRRCCCRSRRSWPTRPGRTPTRSRSCARRCSIRRTSSNSRPMKRRQFLRSTAAVAAFALPALRAHAAVADYRKVLVLVELKGGNDGLNTLVPYADPAYYALRPKIAIARDQVVQLSDRAGLHPSLAPLAKLWKRRQPRRRCRAWAIPTRTSRTSARSRSGTRRARARRTSRKAGSRAPSSRSRCPRRSPPTA